MANRKIAGVFLSLTVACFTTSPSVAETIHMGGSRLEAIEAGALYPEGMEYDAGTRKFLLGSFREGAVYAVGEDGTSRRLVQDDRLITVLGIRVDAKRNRLYVANSDLGVSIRHSAKGPLTLASLGIYDLTTGQALNLVDLGALRPEGEKHIANDLTFDGEGNVYVTDSLAPVIYKIDAAGKASVFLVSRDRFAGRDVNLNGIAYHPDGYLILAKKSDGVLFKVPLADPHRFTEIEATQKFVGADGLVLVNGRELAVITNIASGIVSNTVYAVTSTDGWRTARVAGGYKYADDTYPTTGVVKDGKIYVVNGRINRLLTNSQAEKAMGYRQPATIQQVGNFLP